MIKKYKYIMCVVLFITILLIISTIKSPINDNKTTSGFAEAPSALAIKPEKTITSKLQVLPKNQVIKKLNISPELVNNPAVEIVDTADIKPARYGATTITTVDTATGEAKTLIEFKPRTAFEILTETTIGARYGVSTTGNQHVDVYARRDLLRVGSVNFALYGDVRNKLSEVNPEARAMIDVSFRW